MAYFSVTGTTKHAAEELAQVMDATLFEIPPETPYTSADLDWDGGKLLNHATKKELENWKQQLDL